MNVCFEILSSFLEVHTGSQAASRRNGEGGGLGMARLKSKHNVDENSLHSIMHLSVWFPVGGTVWEGLGGVVLLEEVCH